MDSLYPELDSVANESQRSSFTKPRACFNPNCTFPFGPACAKCSAEFDRHHQKRKAEKEARVKRWIQEDAEDLHFPPELVARSQVDNGMLFQRKSSTSSGGTFLPTSSTQQSLVSPTQREGDTGSGSPSQHSGGSSKSSGATISQKPQTRLSIEAIRARSQRWLPKSTSSEATVISRLARVRSQERSSPGESTPGSPSLTPASSDRSSGHRSFGESEGFPSPALALPSSFYSSTISTNGLRPARMNDWLSDIFSNTLNAQLQGTNFTGGAQDFNITTDFCPLCHAPLRPVTDQHLLQCIYAHEEKILMNEYLARAAERGRR